jgi:Fe-S-cluster-containing dehydrogenase component
MDRRKFIKNAIASIGVVGVAGLAGPAAHALSKEEGSQEPALTTDGHLINAHKHTQSDHMRSGDPKRKWVMVIDLSKCDGCKVCTVECNKMHHNPPDREWIKVLEMQDSPKTAPYWFPKPCYHCDNPPCTKVCPVGATFKRNDGAVLIDNDRCIGCRFCMAACPYSSRSFNWSVPADANGKQAYSPETGYPKVVGTVEKCDLCTDMATEGKLPACVGKCSMKALYYGDQNEDAVTCYGGETVQLSKLLKDKAGYRYLESLGTEPSVYYLPPVDRIFASPENKMKCKTDEST